MKIADIKATVEHIKPQRDSDAYAGQESLTFLRCTVTTDDGLTGAGVTGRFLAAEVAHLLNGGMAAALAGVNPLDHEAVSALLARKFNPRQSTGVFVSALSALDLALWDIKGKALAQPVARLIGGAHTAMPAYATAGLPAFSEAELVAACKKALANGFRGAKIIVGAGRSIDEDAQRIRAVRAVIGTAPLMLDANCAYTVAEAKRLAALVADCDIAFFEEPLRGNDIPSLAALRRAISIPLASGQMIQSVTWFRDALTTGALDILQPNAAFCGGLTAMLRILALAEAHGVPVTGAGGFEAANLPAMAGHAHGGMLEVHGAHVALRARFATEPEFRDGQLHVPAVPGLGFSLKD
ncbi:MAG: mandelate racemase/muconate lactonizing enzyme family protein [Betaproteobacteria bacterium]|jgi:L-rhamnonate dehydratase|nr:mandelate racemase/muconate lactonizing enzyme family protein [Betaproteobacteria bacterium]MDH5341651.1 mandelate racemase/muconate lactonizing enzyme family protein [Betaproteobacteria bacterium]